MSLEHGKKYAVSLMHKEDGDKSAERINKATPHQVQIGDSDDEGPVADLA